MLVFNQINKKTAEPIWPNFCVRPHKNAGKVWDDQIVKS